MILWLFFWKMAHILNLWGKNPKIFCCWYLAVLKLLEFTTYLFTLPSQLYFISFVTCVQLSERYLAFPSLSFAEAFRALSNSSWRKYERQPCSTVGQNLKIYPLHHIWTETPPLILCSVTSVVISAHPFMLSW